jgi:hypothetical protein
MIYLKLFENFDLKFYESVNNINDYYYYQIPFYFYEKEFEFKPDDVDNSFSLYFSNSNFYYDKLISDEEIENALKLDLENIDISKDWNGQTGGFFAYENINIHILRIAKLVSEIRKNIPIKPVSLMFDERAFEYHIPNYIEDGNHRIRALKFLKYDGFPAYVWGSHAKSLIKKLTELKLNRE